jgi:hypothetical protein
MSFEIRLAGGCITRTRVSVLPGYVILAAMLLAPLPASAQDPAKALSAKARAAIARTALLKVPPHIDASPLPRLKGDFISLGADGRWSTRGEGKQFLTSDVTGGQDPTADCSREAIVHYAKAAPSVFEGDKKGLLYGVQTHTPETRMMTRYWDMPGFNSCALVVYAILKRAGCPWAKYTADAKAIYDMANDAGWRPSTVQEGGCMVAWNSKSDGPRARIGDKQKQSRRGNTRFRHVGIATGNLLSVDNTSWLSRPTTFFTFRPIIYEPPIFLCPTPAESRPEGVATPKQN